MLLYLNHMRTPKYYQIAYLNYMRTPKYLSDCFEGPMAIIDDHPML